MRNILILAFIMAALLPSACLAASHGGDRTSHETSSRSRQSSGGYSGRASSARQSTGYVGRTSSNRQSSYRPTSTGQSYRPSNTSGYSGSHYGNSDSYRPSNIRSNGNGRRYYRNRDGLLCLVTGLVLGSALDSQSCDEPTYVSQPVVYEPLELPVVYAAPPVEAQICNSSPVTVQQTVINNNKNDPLPALELPALEQACDITGHVKLLGLCRSTSICIPADKPVSKGTEIWFICKSQIVGKFQVAAVDIDAATVTVEKISGSEPKNGTGFAIVYPN